LNPLDIFLLSIDGLSERKFRFALNLVGILIGCAAITGLISMTQGLQTNVSDQLDMFGPTNLMIIPGEVGGGPPMQGGIKFNWRDVEIISKLEDVKDATPIISMFSPSTLSRAGSSGPISTGLPPSTRSLTPTLSWPREGTLSYQIQPWSSWAPTWPTLRTWTSPSSSWVTGSR